MGTSYSQGAQSANALGEAFVAGALYASSVVGTTAQATVVSAAPGFIPDFVFSQGRLAAETQGGNITINGTTGVVTWTRTTTAATLTLSYVLGNLE